jgi:hypothetical protein
MPFGELVTSLRADLQQYERDLNAAYAKAEAWAKKVEALQVRVSAPGVAGNGGRTGTRESRFGAGPPVSEARVAQEQARRDNDAHFRQVISLNRQAEAEQRRMSGIQNRAAEEEFRVRERNYKQIILLKRHLEEQDKATARATLKTSREEMAARNADVKQQILLKRHLDEQDKKALQEVERLRVKMVHEDAQAKQNDVKQRIIFKRHLEQEEKKDYEREVRRIQIAENREASERRFRAKQTKAHEENEARDLRRESDTRRRIAIQSKAERENVHLDTSRETRQRQMVGVQNRAERENNRIAAEEMKAKNANIKQQIGFKRYLDDQDKQEQQKQRQGQRDEIRAAKVASVRAEFERANSTIGRMDRAIKALDGGSLNNLLATVKQVVVAFGLIEASRSIAGGIAAAIKGGIDLNREYQRQLTTMGSILAMTTRVADSQGHSVSRQTALNYQLKEAGKLYTLIRREAASTILTGRELFGAVSANLGLGSAAGMSPEQTVQLTKQVTQLAKASGLSGERQFAQETRALLTGQGLQSGTVARILGVFSKKQIDEHVQKGDLFQFIMDRVNRAKPVLDKFRLSMDGVLTTLTTKAQDLNRMAFEKFFEKLTHRIGDLNEVLTQDRLQAWAEKISDGLVKVFDTINQFVSGGGFQKLIDFFNLLVNHGADLVKIFLAMRGALAIGSAAAGLRDFQRNEQRLKTEKTLLAAQQGAGALAGVGGVAAGAGGASGAAGAVGAAASKEVAGGLAAVAGAVSTGLSLVAAALAGWGIGTGIRELLDEHGARGLGVARRAEDASAAELRRLRNDPKTKSGARVTLARERSREMIQAAVDEMTGKNNNDDAGTPAGNRRALREKLDTLVGAVIRGGFESSHEFGKKGSTLKAAQAAYFRQGQVEEGEFKANQAQRKTRLTEDDLHLISLAAEANERLRREAANKQRVENGLQIAKLREDKVREINAQAQLDAITARKKIADTSQLRKVLFEIDRKRIEDIRDFREQQLIDYKQMLAQQLGLTKETLDAEYLATVKSIEDKKYAADKEEKLKAAALAHHQRQLRDNNDEQMIAERRFNADTTGNIIEQLNTEFLEKAAAVRKEVEANYKGQAAIDETRRRFHKLNMQYLRERRDRVQEVEDKGRDLARRSHQMERERANLVKQYTKEVSDAQKQMARELRDLTKEQTQAQRELGHAQRQTLQDSFKLGHERRFVPFEKGRNRPAGLAAEPGEMLTTRGILQPKFGGVNTVGLQDETSQLIEETGVNDVLRQVMIRKHGETVGPALAERAIRELRDTVAGGDVEGGLGRLAELGVNAGGDFRKGARKIAATAIGAQNEEVAFQDREARVDLGQQREDQGKIVTDAQQRLQDLDEKQTELFKTYADTITNLGINFNEAILKGADDLKTLRQEIVKFTETLAASGVKISDAYLKVIGETANTRGKGAGQAGAETLAKAQGANVYNMIFGAGAIKLDAAGQKALEVLADAIEKQRLRTAPARS